MQADNSQYVKALDQATTKLQKFSADQGKIFDDIASKLAAAFSIDALVEFSESAIESAASLDKLSQAAGISVESLSSLRLAAAAGGLSQDELGQSLKKLNVNLSDAAGNATGKAGVAFRALGISVTDASGNVKDAGTVLGEIADKFQGFADGPNKTAIAVELLGRQGQNLIPILNQGSAGLDNFRAQAEAAGIVVSGPLAAAAEEFEQKFAVMKATLSEGFGNQLAAQLLPVLSTLSEQLTSSSSAGQAFSVVAGVIVGGVKLVAATVIEVVSEFTQLGDSIGALGAIAAAVARGNFAEAAEIWKQSNADNVATARNAQNQITDIMEAGTDQQLSIIQVTAKKIQAQAPNVASLEQADAAIKKLQDFNDNLKAEASAFGLGGAALTNYKLQYGPLADAIKKAGDEGTKLAASIRANAAVLQGKQDTKEITDYTDKLQEQVLKYGQGDVAAVDYATSTGKLGEAFSRAGAAGAAARQSAHDLAIELTNDKDKDALFSVDQQILTMSGHLQEAAVAAFNFQNRLLIKNVASTGNAGDQAKLDFLKQQQVAQAAFTEQVNLSTKAQTDYGTAEATTQLAQANGNITDLQAMAQLDTARKAEIDQLTQIYNAEKSIADASGDPKLIQNAQALQNQIKQLQASTDQLAKTIRGDLEDDAANSFLEIETGAKSAKAAVEDFFKDLEKQLLQMANKDIAQSIFGTGGAGGGIPGALAGLFGGSPSGAGAGDLLSSLFGSGSSPVIQGVVQNGGTGGGLGNLVGSLDGFATGGTIPSGSMGVVGEKGPELAYAGAKDLNIIPNGGGGKPISITNNFTSAAPGGQISRPSQMQQAAAAARSLQQASRRNNT